ncbi:MAG: SseB family protein [Actinomycetota bacterium]|nr:SseB family protein [Actinomycetota bacterium]
MTPGGKKLARPLSPTDDGAPDLALRAELVAPTAAVIEILKSARLLAAVVVVPDEIGTAGPDKSGHLASVSMINATGEKGLLAFTGLDSLASWDRSARPVPVLGISAAKSAIEDGAQALVIDVAGPHRFVVTGAALIALAGGG